jgi:predicted restriction endonuclease
LHIWPVASIKRTHNVNLDPKIQYATDGDNGLWLCNNHHKLFDINFLLINNQGQIQYKSNIRAVDETFINKTTLNLQIGKEILTSKFLYYLELRNKLIDQTMYRFMR